MKKPPTAPGDKLKELYFAIGVATTHWQWVEMELTQLFSVLVWTRDGTASAVFNTVPSFPTKLRMVKAAAAVRLAETDLLKPCIQLCDRLGTTATKRNELAHYMLFQQSPMGNFHIEEVDWYLSPTAFDGARDWRHKGKPPRLKIEDIQNRTKAFREASIEIRNFSWRVQKALGIVTGVVDIKQKYPPPGR
jgi:hypothetical protein